MSETALQLDGPGTDLDAFEQDWALTLVLRASADGAPLAEHRVAETDLAEARSEAWLNGFLRRGQPDLPLEAVSTRLLPVVKEGQCLGFVLRAESPGADASMHTFGVASLGPLAYLVSKRLVAEGPLHYGDTYVYELRPQRGTPTGPGTAAATGAHDSSAHRSMQITTRTAALRYSQRPLTPLRDTARVVGEIDAAVLPVFFTESAHEKSRNFARKGADDNPPVETGSLLIGELGVCPDSGEMSVTVLDAIEVADAEQREFSLIPSSKTWTRVQAVLGRLTGVDGTRRLLGQSHGHNFALDGEPCAMCATAKECGRTTVFVSAADRSFMRTVFAGQTYALCWIAGSNARGDEVATLFTLRAGVLNPRGYYIIDDFVSD